MKECITLHCTDLDGWVWYNRLDSMTKDEFIGRLLRTDPPNFKMLAGTAFHSIMENPPDLISTINKDGFTFIVDCDVEIQLPQVREIRANKTYFVNGVYVTLTGGTDGITGNRVDDHKLTFDPKPENYFDSYQWRAYLDIYNADMFKYILYHGVEDGNTITIKDVSTMFMYRYPNMQNDLMYKISELLLFTRDNIPGMIKTHT
jgi:hypothetical protein